MPPLVSILIPCYNAERWVTQCIESALAQTWPDKDVIVVDDGSTDSSLEIIKSFGDRIRWETGPNRGSNRTRNRLLELARGDWLQYLDADDYLLPDKITAQMDSLATRPQSDVVYSPMLLHFISSQEPKPVPNPNPINTEDIWIGLVRWYTPQTGGYLFRRQALVDAGAWNAAQPCCQDNEMCLRLLMCGKQFAFCPSMGAVYRLGSNESVSSRNRALVREHRLEIINKAEDFLRRSGQLTERRLWAINQARFEQARVAWGWEPAVAYAILQTIRRSQPGFIPGEPVPATYRALYRLLGFRITETIGSWRRGFSRLSRSARQNTL
jgi:glycosyltransferase involved in cell wall biosynthesis